MLIAIAAAAVCVLDEPPDAEGLLRAERAWVRALKERDIAALACRLAPGFMDTSWRGERIDRDTVLAALPARPTSRLVLSELRAEPLDRAGVVRGLNTEVDPDGQIVGKVRFTDVFIRADGGWRAIAAQETVVARDATTR